MKTAEEIFEFIISLYEVDGSFERWTDYRKRITEYLISKMDEGKTVAILGVGEANDLDLSKIHSHVSKLTLVDIDLEKIKKATRKYGLEGSNKISIVQADFVGITKKDYVSAIAPVRRDIVKNKQFFSPYVSGPKYLQVINQILEHVNSHSIELGIDEHDYVIAIGVHSQLFGLLERPWDLLMHSIGKTGEAYSPIIKRVIEQNNVFMPKFNDAILAKSKEKAFIGLEQLELERNVCPNGAMQAQSDIYEKIPRENHVVYMDVWSYRDGLTYQMGINVINKM